MLLANLGKKIKYKFERRLANMVIEKQLYHKKAPDRHNFMLIFGSLSSQLYRSGIKLGLYDLLDQQEGLTFTEISQALNIEPYPLRVFLNSLEYLDVIQQISGRYYNNPMLTFPALTKHKSVFAMEDTLDYFNVVVDPSFSELTESIKQNKPKGLHKMYGDDCPCFYEAISCDQHKHPYFSTFMEGFSKINLQQLARQPLFGRCKRVLDVGGNKGGLLLTLAAQHPQLHGTVFDFPEVISIARQRFAEQGLSDRLDAISGNVADGLPSGYDCITMFHFIDIFSPEQNQQIFRHAYQALPSGGHLCIFTPITYRDKRCANDLMGNYFLNMANGQGEFYDVESITLWLEQAKFTVVENKKYFANEVFLVARKG